MTALEQYLSSNNAQRVYGRAAANQWLDLSGNGVHVMQINTTGDAGDTEIVDGLLTLTDSDGIKVNNELNTVSAASPELTAPFTWFVVFELAAIKTHHYLVGELTSITPSNSDRSAPYRLSVSNSLLRLEVDIGNGDTRSTGNGSVLTTGRYVAAFKVTPDTISLYLDGSPYGTSTSLPVPMISDVARVYFAADGMPGHLDGSLIAAFCFDSDIPDTEISHVTDLINGVVMNDESVFGIPGLALSSRLG